ncbi:MAG: hypothetical protein LUM44_04015 [Pyrinomonadaceae bacterium]|nr:hypothetical protein [Pyrinomonadaceae bacterium]
MNFSRRLWLFHAEYEFFTPFMALSAGHSFYPPQSPDAGADGLFSDIFRRVKCKRT